MRKMCDTLVSCFLVVTLAAGLVSLAALHNWDSQNAVITLLVSTGLSHVLIVVEPMYRRRISLTLATIHHIYFPLALYYCFAHFPSELFMKICYYAMFPLICSLILIAVILCSLYMTKTVEV